MSTRTLPARPNLDQLKLQASELQQAHHRGDVSAAARIAAHHPRRTSWSPAQVLAERLITADAQLVIAREYGFVDWAALKHHVETIGSLVDYAPHPKFADALAALDAGDARELRRLLDADPSLAVARTRLDPRYDEGSRVRGFDGSTGRRVDGSTGRRVDGSTGRRVDGSTRKTGARLDLSDGRSSRFCEVGPSLLLP